MKKRHSPRYVELRGEKKGGDKGWEGARIER